MEKLFSKITVTAALRNQVTYESRHSSIMRMLNKEVASEDACIDESRLVLFVETLLVDDFLRNLPGVIHTLGLKAVKGDQTVQSFIDNDCSSTGSIAFVPGDAVMDCLVQCRALADRRQYNETSVALGQFIAEVHDYIDNANKHLTAGDPPDSDSPESEEG